MFTVALFTTVKIWKQPKCPSTDNEYIYLQSVSQFSHSVVSDSLRHHGLQHASLPCPSPTPGACSNSCPLSWWYHPTISSSVIPFSSLPSIFSSIGVFSNELALHNRWQSIETSASTSVLPMNIQVWFPLRLTGLISLLSKGLSRVFSRTTIWKHLFFCVQPSLWSNSHIHIWLLEKHELWL